VCRLPNKHKGLIHVLIHETPRGAILMMGMKFFALWALSMALAGAALISIFAA
jgi:hypothetical protein